MNLGDVQTRVKRQFGDDSGAQITDADITRWANDGQLDLVRRTKCNQVENSTLSVVGTTLYPILTFVDVSRVQYDGRPLRPVSRQQMDDFFPSRNVTGVANGLPIYYTMVSSGIELYPIPDTSGLTITVLYIKRPVELVNTTDPLEIPTQYHEDVVRFCLLRAYELDGQHAAADRVKVDYRERSVETRHDVQNPGDESYPAVRPVSGDFGEVY